MVNSKRVLAVVPARGGSKGVPLKNLRKINGVPITVIAGKLAQEIQEINRVVISTDHSGIAEVCGEHGLDVPFYRPKEISGDRIGDLEVLRHALLETEMLERDKYDAVVMLQPTSPLRKKEHVLGAINLFLSSDYDSVWTVSPTDLKYHPLKTLSVDERGTLSFYDDKGAEIIARQQLVPTYHRNGAAYVISRDCILNQNSIMGKSSAAYIINEPMISIDTEEDIKLVEEQFNKLNIK